MSNQDDLETLPYRTKNTLRPYEEYMRYKQTRSYYEHIENGTLLISLSEMHDQFSNMVTELTEDKGMHLNEAEEVARNAIMP